MSTRNVWASISLAGVMLAGWSAMPAAHAQQATSGRRTTADTPLPDVTVDAPRQRQVAGRTSSAGQAAKRMLRPAARRAAAPAQAAAQPTPSSAGSAATPLNGDATPAIGSRLGLTAREVPAAVEVIGAETLREQGYHTTVDAVKGATGVSAGDAPNDVGFAMRGFQGNQVNVLYNGINIGPTGFTALTMETFNLDRVEFLKGPSSLSSGQGAVGGTINFVTKTPHTGPVQNEAFVGFDQRGTFRSGFGSGGSTTVPGLDYRFDISRTKEVGFIDDTEFKNVHVSGQLNYRLSDSFKTFVAAEFKDYKAKPYEGTPLVPAADSGTNATAGIVSGSKISAYNSSTLDAVTIDRRTLSTNYNVIDGHKTIKESWVRSGFEWDLNNAVTLRSQIYNYNASRDWYNNEIAAYNSLTKQVDRERFFVHHNHNIVGNITDVTWNGRIFGLDNRLVGSIESSHTDFTRPGAANFPGEPVPLVGFDRGTYGDLRTQLQTATIDSVALNIEDKLKLTDSFALIGGLRYNPFTLDRSWIRNGAERPGFPYSKSWQPLTGRIGYTWEALPGTTFYSQYATATDISADSIFILSPTQNLTLSDSRSYETGVKQLLWNGRAEWTFSAFDIERNNVYSAQAGQQLNLAGKVKSQGIEIAAAVRPTPESKLWGNVAYVRARYADYDLADGSRSFSGNTPPNIPAVIINGGASYRFPNPGWWPVELGFSVRHVGDRWSTDANTVKLLAYTTADLFAFVDLPKVPLFATATSTRLAFRVRNVTDKRYAAWSDPFYPDQIFLGAPRTYEVEASFKF
ncbi:TonB-dependent receptor [Bradyrhizobium sp. 83012]|uniref:TonB-dependent receptor n=1 Tax=Bradyrhizobium aeschynomenes TaxID=2734909 RepID=A0ABX2CK99_9BRAD|nr:TonB-dependent receptor [Bradyrhizobium aeschynomenes]NPU68338.1 TonB-dependent receptor [Bradyrhizobium aeschynomenes]